MHRAMIAAGAPPSTTAKCSYFTLFFKVMQWVTTAEEAFA